MSSVFNDTGKYNPSVSSWNVYFADIRAPEPLRRHLAQSSMKIYENRIRKRLNREKDNKRILVLGGQPTNRKQINCFFLFDRTFNQNIMREKKERYFWHPNTQDYIIFKVCLISKPFSSEIGQKC